MGKWTFRDAGSEGEVRSETDVRFSKDPQNLKFVPPVFKGSKSTIGGGDILEEFH